MAMTMSGDTEMHISSSPDISPQTPTMTPSPPLREMSRSLSLESEEGIFSSPQPALAVGHSESSKRVTSESRSPSLVNERQASADAQDNGRVLDDNRHPFSSSQVTTTPTVTRQLEPPRSLSTQSKSTIILPRINTQSPLIRPRPGPTSTTTGMSVGFGLEAFKLSSPAAISQTRPHLQPWPLSKGVSLPPVHTLHLHSHFNSQSPDDTLQQPVQSDTIATRSHGRHGSFNLARPQHQRLASLPSIHMRERDDLYPTPTSVAPHSRLPASASAFTRQSDVHVHPYPIPPHRRYPSVDSTRLPTHAQYVHPMYQAPPPPPSLPSSQLLGTETRHAANRPKLQIHPYAHPKNDPRYFSAGSMSSGITSGMQPTPSQVSSSSTTVQSMYQTPMTGYGRDRMFQSPSSGISPGGFKAPRKRADDAQLGILNEVFERTAYPSTEERDVLAKRLGMTSRSVQIWFQNRRRAVKVDAQSAIQRAEAEVQAQIHIRGEHPLKHARSSTEHTNVQRTGGHTSMDIKQTMGSASAAAGIGFQPSAVVDGTLAQSGAGHVRGHSDGSPFSSHTRSRSVRDVWGCRADMSQPQLHPQPLALPHDLVSLQHRPIAQMCTHAQHGHVGEQQQQQQHFGHTTNSHRTDRSDEYPRDETVSGGMSAGRQVKR
ncbi:hypothetical protein IAU59_002885 [Kwoniella sp. CBS 9459]